MRGEHKMLQAVVVYMSSKVEETGGIRKSSTSART